MLPIHTKLGHIKKNCTITTNEVNTLYFWGTDIMASEDLSHTECNENDTNTSFLII